MSFDLTAAALKVTGLTALEFRVLAVLASHSNAATGLCCPARATLAREAECSVSQVARALRTLKARGLVRQISRGPRATPRYEFPGLVSYKHEPFRGSMGATQNKEVIKNPDKKRERDLEAMGKTGKSPKGERSPKQYTHHPLADLLPEMEEQEFRNLVEDIRQHGLRQPIVLFEGKILDGRHRYRACLEAGRDPFFEEFSGDAVAYVFSLNLHRRHLSTSQRAIAAARLANHQPGRPAAKTGKIAGLSAPEGDAKADTTQTEPDAPPAPTDGLTQSRAAEALGVSERTVRDARVVLKEGDPDTVKAVEAGEKSVAEAAREIREKQRKDQPVVDRFGHVIPEEILPDWRRAEEWAKKSAAAISRIRCDIEDGMESKDRVYRRVPQDVISTLKSAQAEVKAVRPYTVCTTCRGHKPDRCTMCKGQGWLSGFTYGAVSQDVRKLHEANAPASAAEADDDV